VFEKYLSRYQSRLLIGSDGVDKWTDQATWNEALLNQRILISTESVLLDALSHAFVKMRKFALLIFDEGLFLPRLFLYEANHVELIVVRKNTPVSA
jgi:hypothetical protein